MPKTINRTIVDEGRKASERTLEGVTAAVQRAVLEHKQAGRAVPTVVDGKVVWIPAEEIDVPDPDAAK